MAKIDYANWDENEEKNRALMKEAVLLDIDGPISLDETAASLSASSDGDETGIYYNFEAPSPDTSAYTITDLWYPGVSHFCLVSDIEEPAATHCVDAYNHFFQSVSACLSSHPLKEDIRLTDVLALDSHCALKMTLSIEDSVPYELYLSFEDVNDQDYADDSFSGNPLPADFLSSVPASLQALYTSVGKNTYNCEVLPLSLLEHYLSFFSFEDWISSLDTFVKEDEDFRYPLNVLHGFSV